MNMNNQNKVCQTCGDESHRQFTCHGCTQSFCWIHLRDHQLFIEKQMEDLQEQDNQLQQNWNNNQYDQHLFNQIDQWENESINQIQTAATRVRDQLQLLLKQSKDNLKVSHKQTSELINQSRQLNNFSEIDINQRTEQLNNIQSQIQTSFNIQIIEDQETLPITFIKIKQNTKRPLDQNEQTAKRPRNEVNNHSIDEMVINTIERFGEVFETPKLYEENFVALNGIDSRSIISGVNSYFNGRHSLHFHIEKVFKKKGHFILLESISNDLRIKSLIGWSCFFGIKTSNENMNDDIWEMKSIYGVWSNGYDIKGGKKSALCRGNRWIENDDATLTLDCDNKQINIGSKRINWCEAFDINLDLCPFPWKFLTIIKRCRIRISNSS